ncbi:hypothetical protein Tco_1102206 [Tanacetum coccineum]
MVSDHVSSDPVPQCPTTVLEHDSLSPDPQSQENVPHLAETVTMSNELDLLFSLMFDELLNGTYSSCVKCLRHVTIADVPKSVSTTTPQLHLLQQTVDADTPSLKLFKQHLTTTISSTNSIATQQHTIMLTENINQAETNKENA